MGAKSASLPKSDIEGPRGIARQITMQRVQFIAEGKLGFSPRAASAAFDPPLGEQTIRRALQVGELRSHVISQRRYILRDDLVAWVKSK